eukprot:1180995-Prorocentrum_minimum.AAC.1
MRPFGRLHRMRFDQGSIDAYRSPLWTPSGPPLDPVHEALVGVLEADLGPLGVQQIVALLAGNLEEGGVHPRPRGDPFDVCEERVAAHLLDGGHGVCLPAARLPVHEQRRHAPARRPFHQRRRRPRVHRLYNTMREYNIITDALAHSLTHALARSLTHPLRHTPTH